MQVPGSFEGLARSIRLSSYNESFYALMAFDYSYAYSSYLDESFDMRQAELFAVGGLIGQGVALFELDRKWAQLCKRLDIDIAYFKASECTLGSGEFEKFVAVPRCPTPAEQKKLDEISCEFIKLIANEQAIGHGITVIQNDFYDVIKDPSAKAVLGDSPYRLAYDLAMIQCAWMCKQVESDLTQQKQPWNKVLRPHVSFVCDEHEENSPLANAAYMKLKQTNPNAAQYMASYTYADEKSLPVLQAADAVAYEIRRSSKVNLGIRSDAYRDQFKILASMKRIGL